MAVFWGFCRPACDHHAAAREIFAALQEARALPPNVEVVVDGDRSAANIAWDFFTDKAGVATGTLVTPPEPHPTQRTG